MMQDSASLIEELESAIAAGTPDKRLNALTRITDLFIAGTGHHSQGVIDLFDDVLSALIATIEVNARAQLSRRLARCTDSPPKVLRSLAFDDSVAVAGPVLTNSSQLTDKDLIDNVNTKSQGHIEAITQRQSLSEPVTDALIERGNDRVVRLVVKNAGARISHKGFGKLVGKAANDEGLARYIGARRDIPRDFFLKLLETASAKVRAKLIASNPTLADAVRETVSGIAADISVDVRNSSRDHAKARARIKRLRRTGQFSEADLHAFANAQDFERVAIAFAALGDFPIELVERALLDKSPDLILILGKAAQCCRATVRSMLLMKSAGRCMSAMDLDETLIHFERLKVKTARSALEFYRLRLGVDDNSNAPSKLALAWYAEAIHATL
ncbi:DUF2336 domain-containing protein [Pseudorhodoplanes sinuspersici]|nr:DUF2336 domain-containing protein [Pseudorhodoplanes sinuspersici]RKE67465.1 uncharacterized protein (DUF2336 family) [Pseudorhodoplanes sinuspersici]